MESKAIAVLISDVHYNLQTLPLADTAMRLAIVKANELNVPLIVAGDLHDTKANMRGECVNAMIETFKLAKHFPTILVGNHDKINEKSVEHSLNFLSNYAQIVRGFSNKLGEFSMLAYQHSTEEYKWYLHNCMAEKILICHQGLNTANMGDYIQDKSAITPQDVAGLIVISGHYHTRQTIQLPNGGKWEYIGSPYTQSWGEAKDPEKGFQILYSDGSLEFVSTNLRKHIIWETNAAFSQGCDITRKPGDLLWVKVTDTREKLSKISKESISKRFGLDDYKLTLHPTEQHSSNATKSVALSQQDLLDSMIDSLTNTKQTTKNRIKSKWKQLCG